MESLKQKFMKTHKNAGVFCGISKRITDESVEMDNPCAPHDEKFPEMTELHWKNSGVSQMRMDNF